MNGVWLCVAGMREVVRCSTANDACADYDGRAIFGGIGGLDGKDAGEVCVAVGHHVVGLETMVG